jgi:PAT family beta-lactamase induction signal transducer AmpG
LKPRRVSWPAPAWVATAYFAEGFPYTIVNSAAEVLYGALGASAQAIGLTSLFHLPWNLKFAWAPLVDRFETKRGWLCAMQALMSIAVATIGVLAAARGASGALAVAFVVLAILSATNDIAIDGYYLDALDSEGQSRFVGYRAMAYKVASWLVRGPFIVLAGAVGWRLGLFGAAAVVALFALAHALVLPRVETRGRPGGELARALVRPRVMLAAVVAVAVVLAWRLPGLEGARAAVAAWVAGAPVLGGAARLGARIGIGGAVGIALAVGLVGLLGARRALARRARDERSYFVASLASFLAQPKAGRMLVFVLLFRTGESFLLKMKVPFFRDALGLDTAAYGVAQTYGVASSVAATMLGGWLIARGGLRRWMWPFVLAQNVLNLLYVGLALAAPGGAVGLTTVTVVATLEHFGEGLGTAVFMVYLMRCCDPAHKATHMAILTALMSVGFTAAGAASGFLATALGFPLYFFATFVATCPAMALIPLLPHVDGRSPT